VITKGTLERSVFRFDLTSINEIIAAIGGARISLSESAIDCLRVFHTKDSIR